MELTDFKLFVGGKNACTAIFLYQGYHKTLTGGTQRFQDSLGGNDTGTAMHSRRQLQRSLYMKRQHRHQLLAVQQVGYM